MHSTPQREHQWLHKLVGEWVSEIESRMGPDQPVMTHRGTEVVRSLGGLWTIGESEGGMPGGDTAKTIMTLGCDPRIGRYVGTFVASMIPNLWIYSGTLDETEKVLTLETEGLDFAQKAMARYNDVITFVDDNYRTMTAQVLGEDGKWTQFMTAHYRRKV